MGLKTYDINRKEELRGDWEEQNNKTQVCYVCVQNNLMVYFCACKYKLINLLKAIFAQRYLPSKKNAIT